MVLDKEEAMNLIIDTQIKKRKKEEKKKRRKKNKHRMLFSRKEGTNERHVVGNILCFIGAIAIVPQPGGSSGFFKAPKNLGGIT
jgi:hypothetical protein